MNKRYILDEIEPEDKILRFFEVELKDYKIELDVIQRHHIGGTELLVYSFLFAHAFEYWDDEIDPSAPAGSIYIEMDLHDFVEVTGCSVQDIRNALQVLNEDRWVRVVEISREYGIVYAYHATC